VAYFQYRCLSLGFGANCKVLSAFMKLLPYSEADFELTSSLESDPEVMKHLGGTLPPVQIRRVHEKRLAGLANGDLYFVIVDDETESRAGIIAAWRSEWEGGTIYELGLLLRPGFQRQRLGWEATQAIIEQARAQRAFQELHAFTAVSNVASNEGCRQFGFRLIGQCDTDYEGRPLRSNHWVISLD
jgi:RimJ/RimL family protein N-acetyltransferase